MMADTKDRPETRRGSQVKRRWSVAKARAGRLVITLRLKPNKRGKKTSRNSEPIVQALLPRWEEEFFEVAIVSSRT